jgi:hypothetical protein
MGITTTITLFKADIQSGGQAPKAGLIGQRNALIHGFQTRQAIKGTTIQEVPTQAPGNQTTYRPLAGTTGPIDGNNGCLFCHVSLASYVPIIE